MGRSNTARQLSASDVARPLCGRSRGSRSARIFMIAASYVEDAVPASQRRERLHVSHQNRGRRRAHRHLPASLKLDQPTACTLSLASWALSQGDLKTGPGLPHTGRTPSRRGEETKRKTVALLHTSRSGYPSLASGPAHAGTASGTLPLRRLRALKRCLPRLLRTRQHKPIVPDVEPAGRVRTVLVDPLDHAFVVAELEVVERSLVLGAMPYSARSSSMSLSMTVHGSQLSVRSIFIAAPRAMALSISSGLK